MKPPSGPKKQTQTNPILSAVGGLFKGQNHLPKNPATPDELGKDFQGCFLPNITIELILNRYSGSLHKSLKLKKLEFLSRTGIIIYSRWKSNFLSVSIRKNGKGRMQ